MIFYDTTFGEVVAQAFPSAVPDLKEAGTCYALNRSTACVFHVIRAMEIALRSLARCSGVKVSGKTVPLEFQEWKNLIDGIEKQSAKYGNLKRGTIKANALEFYSGCLADFKHFKDAIRNILVHNRRGIYKDGEAISALIRAKDCLRRMAPKVPEHRTRQLTSLDFRE